MTSFPIRRMAFADQLRTLRERAGLSGKEFADGIGWHNSKVSKIETGKQTPTDAELVSWLDTLDVPDTDVTRLRSELRELRIQQISWRRQLRTGHRARQEEDARTERAAAVIRAVDTAAVPGLLQTPDYARHIFATQVALLDVPDDIEAAVAARMARQQIIYEPGKRIEIIVTEAALRQPVCPPEVMAVQLDRLTSAIGLPAVRFGILPLDRRLPHVPWHGYWIVDDTVYVENITGESRVADPDDVAIYHRLTDRLWSAAVESDQARALLARVARSELNGP